MTTHETPFKSESHKDEWHKALEFATQANAKSDAIIKALKLLANKYKNSYKTNGLIHSNQFEFILLSSPYIIHQSSA